MIQGKLAPRFTANSLTRMRSRFFTILLLLPLLAASGCVNLTVETDPTKDWSAERLYQEAKDERERNGYETAISYLEKLEARYPYGSLAAQAQLDVAYIYYRDDEPTLALAAAERFIRLHPLHPSVDYAYYLKGLVYFNVRRGPFDWLMGSNVDYSDRDPEGMRNALTAFRELIKRFPDSKYAPDAQLRITYLVNLMAKSEMHVAHYYYKMEAYVATVNRCKFVLQNYPKTPATEDALGVMAMAYRKMGYTNLLQDSIRVLKLNYPNSRYLERIAAMGNDKTTNGDTG